MENLIKPDIGLIFWTVVCFVLLVILLAKTVWNPLMKGVKNREERIQKDKDQAAAAKKNAEATREELDRKLSALKEDVKTKLAEAEAEAMQAKNSILEEAKQNAEKISSDAKKEIEQQKKDAFDGLRKKVAEISLMAAEKVVGEKLDGEKDAAMTDRIISELERDGNGSKENGRR